MRKEELSSHIHDIGGFDRVQLAEAECGRVLLKLDVPDTMLNVYGIVHGGALFTLCDMASGLVALTMGMTAVTLDGAIHYLRPAQTGALLVEGVNVHGGRRTAVNRISVYDGARRLLATADFTMFRRDEPAR